MQSSGAMQTLFSRPKERFFFPLVFAMCGAVTVAAMSQSGCATPAERSAMAGLEAFRACEMREANAQFSAAFDADSRADFAFAYALSDLAVLLEDPAIASLAPRLGFTGQINTSELWRRGGLLDLLSTPATSCSTISERARAAFPHPSLRSEGPSFASTLDPTLKLSDVRAALISLAPRFEKVARALEIGSAHAGDGVTLEGGCGVGSIRVGATELLAVASVLETIRGVTIMSTVYDADLVVKSLLETPSDFSARAAFANELTARVLKVVDAPAGERARVVLKRAISLGHRAIVSARAIRTTPAGAAFDWTRLPTGFLADLETLAAFGLTAIDATEPTLIPFVAPALRVEARAFFSRPMGIDMTFTALADYPSIESACVRSTTTPELCAAEVEVNTRFTPALYRSTGSVQLTNQLSDRFDFAGSLTDTFDPAGRWSRAYRCE